MLFGDNEFSYFSKQIQKNKMKHITYYFRFYNLEDIKNKKTN